MTFSLERSADVGNTSRVASVRASYRALRNALGPPHHEEVDEEGAASTSQWILREKGTGEVVTIYDWKATRLYDPQSRLPTLAAFRAKPSVEWSVGARNAVVGKRFASWIRSRIGGGGRTKGVPKTHRSKKAPSKPRPSKVRGSKKRASKAEGTSLGQKLATRMYALIGRIS
jgi:hypothetical protein